VGLAHSGAAMPMDRHDDVLEVTDGLRTPS
jgi:hypothetical protein